LSVTVRDAHTLLASFRVTPGYYLYRDKVSLSIKGNAAKIAKINLPEGEIKQDPNFGEMHVFHQSFQAEIELDPATRVQQLTLLATYQGCSEGGICYPPIDKEIALKLGSSRAVSASPKASPVASPTPAASHPVAASAPVATSAARPASENSQIAALLKQGNFWLVISAFFGFGLLLALTPCVFPMVPILSGIIVGRGHHLTHKHAFILSMSYVQGMALTFAAAGVAAGLSGTLLSNALQTTAVLGAFAAIFVVLSLSMFGFYELQLPSALQSKLSNSSNRLHGGHISSVFLMGALSAVIVSPCVSAPLFGALLYIGQTRDAVLGGSALYAMALGMGVPLLLIGSSAGALLPKAGAWMESVKRFFGVLLLAVAIWIVAPVLPVAVQMLLWAILLVVSAVYMHALDELPHNASGWRKLWKGLGLLALLLGSAYLAGALSGARDILKPLSGFGGGARAESSEQLTFERVRSLAELNQRLNQAKGKTVMLDFYADWCVSCKEMERFAFADARVRVKLRNTLLLQADVTANSEDDKALLQHFSLYGPPAILLFDKRGNEVGDYRITGYQDADQFLQSLNQAI
ncbi:MAG TPA: protein-disulfide reductase DsbD, partial [Gallionellaceae bacterium]|nr:protein-disulfide reductase DsbD [Gallionellaceae bacterium]